LIAGPIESLDWDTTVWPAHFSAGLGGNGAVTAWVAAKSGCQVQLLSAAGDDDAGRSCLGLLRDAGVSYLSACGELSGDTAITMGVFRADGARSLIHKPGVLTSAFGHVDSLHPFLQGGVSRVHIANPFAVPALRRRAATYLEEARTAGMHTSLDTGWDRLGEWMRVLGPCLPFVDWLFVNEAECLRLAESESLEEAVRRLREAGAANIVVKRGSAGCLLCETGREFLPIPAMPADVVDSTGAGDCFCGGFLAALEHNATPMQAALLGNECGAASVSQAGAITALREWNQFKK
jgi:sugar/nucleoside kinase (ribokinase family)